MPARLAARDLEQSSWPGACPLQLATRIRASHGNVTVHEDPGTGHPELIGALASPLRLLAPVFLDSVAFVRGRFDTV